MLASRSKSGSRDRVLYHYLKGMLCCGRCDSQGRTTRLIYTEAKGRNGTRYGYFFCRGRQEGFCDLPHLPSWQVEDAIEEHYRTVLVSGDFAAAVREQIEAALADEQKLTEELRAQLNRQLAKLEAREQRLIDLAADGLLDRSKILARSNAIKMERVRIEARMADTSVELAVGAERLRTCLDLVTDPVTLYAGATDDIRRQLNETFFQRFYLEDNPLAVVKDDRKPPFDEIQDANLAYQRYKELTLGKRPRTSKTGQICTLGTQTNRRRDLTAATPDDYPTPVLADLFLVSGSSKRVVVALSELKLNSQLVTYLRRCGEGAVEAAVRAEIEPPTGRQYQPWAIERRLGESDVQTIISEFMAGTPKHVLAGRYSVSLSALKNLLRRRDIRRDRRRGTPH